MKPKILLLTTNLGKGGAQRVFYDHAKAFSKEFEVHEAVFNQNEAERFYDSGLTLHSLDVSEGKNPLDKVAKLFKRARRLRALIEKHSFDLVISHMDGANWVNVLSRSKAKKILVVHGTILQDYSLKPIVQTLRKRVLIPTLYQRANLTVAVSEGIKYQLQHYCGLKKAIAIPNYFDIAEIEKLSNEPLSPAWQHLFKNHQVLATSGRLHIQKQQQFLIDLFALLKEGNANLKLVILGDGPLREQLINQAISKRLKVFSTWQSPQQLDDSFDIYFPGYVKNPFQFLKQSSLFLFPSGWEGFPMALCEAMISGVPVLSTDCPTGPREIIAPGTFDPHFSLQRAEGTQLGYLMPMVDKPQALPIWETVVVELLNNKKKRACLAAKAKNRMLLLDKPIILNHWINQIKTVLLNN